VVALERMALLLLVFIYNIEHETLLQICISTSLAPNVQSKRTSTSWF